MATTTIAPQTASFKAIVADLYGDERTPAPRIQEHESFLKTLCEVTTNARNAFPRNAARIENAVQIVIDGGLTMQTDGTAVVQSQTDKHVSYVVNGHCECPDAQHNAPDGLCKHRLSTYIYRRVQQQLAALDAEYAPTPLDGCQVIMDQDGVPCEAVNATCPGHTPEVIMPEPEAPRPTPTLTLPEAPASANVRVTLHGREVQITLRDTDEARLLERLEALLQRFPVAEPASVIAPATASTPSEGWCAIHAVQMRQNTKEGRTWYSHKVGETWCKGK